MIYDICVAGGGASGMAAAISAAREGAGVLVLEKMDRLGRKILATGNGRCNLTNNNIKKSAGNLPYRCSQQDFPGKISASFDSGDALVFFRSLGILTCQRGEYVYPMSLQASAVRDALEREISSLKNIRVRTEKKKKSVKKDKAFFSIETEDGKIFRSRKLIISCGGRSSSKLGSDGSGYGLCKSLGHRIIEPVPALCALKCKEKFFHSLAGVRTQASVQILDGTQVLSCDSGELQLTNYGISGIPVFQVSRFAARALYEGRKVRARLDLLPQMDEDQIRSFISRTCQRHKTYTMEEILTGILNDKLTAVLTDLALGQGKRQGGGNAGKQPRIYGSQWGKKDVFRLIKLIKGLTVNITDTNGFDQSQVSAGGADTSQFLPDSLESRLVKGLYVTGELLDVDGICGGYNLQWAWATGCIAGQSAGKDFYDKD